jgi:hypothetical protein
MKKKLMKMKMKRNSFGLYGIVDVVDCWDDGLPLLEKGK